MQELKAALKSAANNLFSVEVEPELTRPEEQFGDFATNIALQLAKQLGKNPREVAEAIVDKLKNLPILADVQIAGPGFINLRLTDETLAKMAFFATKLPKPYATQEIVIEYSDPNPFKILHVGHLYTSVVGDAISNLFSNYGANVHRVNFGGDVGLHAAKTIWSIIQKLGGEHPDKLLEVPIDQRAQWMAEEYVAGSLAYGDDERIDGEIKELNKKIYQIHERQDKTSPLAKIYWITRQWSYDYFEEFYKRFNALGFEKYYPESVTVEPGMKAVKENTGKVFEESEGAIVFKGEVHNMHTRVFINSQGLPTYETKDVGLILKKWEDFHFDRSIVITGNEIYEYMQVVLKAVEQFAPELVQKTTHITHGLVKLAGGVKMSSRLGNIVSANSVLEMARHANKEINKQDNEDTALGAIKYSFLKQRLGADLIYDPAESVSLEGNSGPYLQYAHARACSILLKANFQEQSLETAKADGLEASERSLARKIGEYPEVVAKASDELMPHHICTYLYELAQSFNSFYEKNRVLDNARQNIRLRLVKAYADVLKNGLNLLNIASPDKM